MSSTSHYRPRVSRETRLLLVTALLSAAALWTLARVQPASISAPAGPVPLLAPFVEGSYAKLAGDVARVQSRLDASLVIIDAADSGAAKESGSVSRSAGLRVGGQKVLTLRRAPPVDLGEGLAVIGYDAASGLTLATTALESMAGSPVPWVADSPRTPRYLVATDVSGTVLTLRPLFVAGLDDFSGPLGRALWRPRARLNVPFGTILFTLDGELVGIVLDEGGVEVVLPGQALLDSASELEAAGLGVPGELGVQVQRLTAALASATGSTSGVVVTWVDPRAQASKTLTPGDVVDTWNDQRLQTPREWDVRMARLRAGDVVRLGVRSAGEARQLSLEAAPRGGLSSIPSRANGAAARLGLTMRLVNGTGSAITRVAPGSAADRAGLARGDIVTRVGTIAAPTPDQIADAFDEAQAGTRVLVAMTREGRHLVTTLDR